MTPAATTFHTPAAARRHSRTEPPAVRRLLIGIALAFLALFLVIPLVFVFAQAFAKGIGYYFTTLRDPNAVSAIKLTLLTAAIAVPLNCFFGVCAAWAIAKFDFPGKNILLTLIDL
ncbi:MAG TPA: sulfate ABC transporter permease subunit CysW, partial [Verrucomicrobiae bacterium]|nr:sulfate ABC transporter permease subunit CysW [Verrucomicrobiae bacterium]